DERSPVQKQGIIGDELPVLRRRSGAVRKPIPVSIHQEYVSSICAAELPRGFNDRLKHSLEVRCGSCDDGKNLARRSELLARLRQLITQPFDLGCHPRIDGWVLVGQPLFVLVGQPSLVLLDHLPPRVRCVPPAASPADQCPPHRCRRTPPSATPAAAFRLLNPLVIQLLTTRTRTRPKQSSRGSAGRERWLSSRQAGTRRVVVGRLESRRDRMRRHHRAAPSSPGITRPRRTVTATSPARARCPPGCRTREGVAGRTCRASRPPGSPGTSGH